MAAVRTLSPLDIEIIAARRQFLAADEQGDYALGDYWFAELRRLYDSDAARSHHTIPAQR